MVHGQSLSEGVYQYTGGANMKAPYKMIAEQILDAWSNLSKESIVNPSIVDLNLQMMVVRMETVNFIRFG